MRSVSRRASVAAVLLAATVIMLAGQTWTQDPNVHPTLINDQPALPNTIFTRANDGRVLLAGAFTHLDNGQRAASGVAYIRADGTVDSSFQATQSSLVNAAMPLKNGGVLGVSVVGGGWEIEPNSVTFRLGRDGAMDASYKPVSVQGYLTLARLADDRFAAWYNTHGMYSSAKGLMRLTEDGAGDATFAAELPADASEVLAAAGQHDGRIVVSIARNAAAPSGALYRVLRLTTTGAIDPTFSPIDTASPYRQLSVTATDQIVASGNGRIARFTADGAPDPTFQSPTGFANWTCNLAIRSDGTIVAPLDYDVAILSADGVIQSRLRDLFPSGEHLQFLTATADGSIFVEHAATSTAPSNQWDWHLARVASTADRKQELDLGIRQRSPGIIQSMAADPASRLIVVGSFNEVDGAPVSRAVRFTPDGKRDPTFALSLDVSPGDIMLVGADSSLLLSRYDAAPDGTTGYHLRRVLSDGSIDRTFNAPPEITAWFAMTSDHRVLAARFTPDATREENYQLVWLAPDGHVDQVLPTRFAGRPRAPGNVFGDALVFAQPQSDGRLLIGGAFTSVNDVTRRSVARLNADGSLDLTYAPNVPALESPTVETPDAHGRVVITGTERRDGIPLRRSLRVLANGELDPTFYNIPVWPYAAQFRQENGLPDLYFPPANSGSTVSIYGVVEAPDGSRWTRTPLTRFVPIDGATVTAQPDGQLKSAGEPATLYAVIGTRGTAAYQWSLNGIAIAGATAPVLTLEHVTSTDGGNYTVRVIGDGQAVVSTPITLTVAGGTGRIVNFSTLTTLSPARVATAGFVVANDGAPRRWLVRAIGNGLHPFGVTTALPQPDLTLLGPAGVIAHDRGTAARTEILEAGGRVGAFPPFLSPYGNMFPDYPDLNVGDSAVLATLTSGAYVARATTTTTQRGTVLVEVYDTIAGGASGGLKNASVRMPLDSEQDRVIMGIVVIGPTSVRLLVRGVGPTLGRYGVQIPLPDPSLTVYDVTGRVLQANSGWADNDNLITAARQVGAFDLSRGSRDAALRIDVKAGVYTLQLNSVSGSRGESLIEVYVMPQ